METWLPNFVDEVQRLLGYSPTTAAAYASDIRRFLAYLEQQGKEVPPASLSADDVVGFLAYEVAAGRSRATVQRRMASLRVLERCLLLTHRIETPFMPAELLLEETLSQSRAPRPTTCLRTEDLQRLWQTLLDSPKRQALRDLALVALLVEWGFPVSALLEIHLQHVDLERRSLWLPSPAGTMLSWKLEGAFGPLKRYLEEGRDGLSPKEGETHLFISQQGKPLSRQSVWHSLRRWGQKAGLEVPLTPRVLRATAAHRLLAQQASPKTIGLALGHTNPLSTTLLVRRLRTACGDTPPAELPTLDASVE